MYARENAHWHVTRIIPDEHLVDLQDGAELFVERLSRNVRQIEIDLVLAVDAHAGETNLKDFSRRDIARNQIAIGRIFLFEKIPPLVLGNRGRRSLVVFSLRYPNAATLTAS